MGQKVNPHGVRVGVIKNWDSKWYADSKNFGDYLVEDYNIRKMLKKKLYASAAGHSCQWRKHFMPVRKTFHAKGKKRREKAAKTQMFQQPFQTAYLSTLDII